MEKVIFFLCELSMYGPTLAYEKTDKGFLALGCEGTNTVL